MTSILRKPSQKGQSISPNLSTRRGALHLRVRSQCNSTTPTAYVDLDPMAGLSKWWARRAAETPILVRSEPDLTAALEHCRQLGIGLVIVDTPPAVSQLVADAVEIADLVVVPCQASPDDLDGIEGTLELLSASDTRSVFVMSRVKSRAAMIVDVVTALSHHGAVCPAMLAGREDYKVSKIRGLSASEFKPKGAAADDVAALWHQIAQYVGVEHGSASVDQRAGAVGPEGNAGAPRSGRSAKSKDGAAGKLSGAKRGGGASRSGEGAPATGDRAVKTAGRRPSRSI